MGALLYGLLEVNFQKDNVHPPRSRVAQDFLLRGQILPRLSRSPDLTLFKARVESDETLDVAVSHCTRYGGGFSKFLHPSTPGQHQMANQLNAGPRCSVYCRRQ